MKTYGGSFVQGLAGAILHADPENLALIKKTWKTYWSTYEKMGKKMKARYEEEMAERTSPTR
jgi:hypothetical protein